jgi:DUF438 domain-containing protein
MNILRDEINHTVLITGNKGEWLFKEQSIITFKGLDICYLIYKVYPNGVTLIDSETSVPKFHSWNRIFNSNHIINDCVQNTGWMEIK